MDTTESKTQPWKAALDGQSSSEATQTPTDGKAATKDESADIFGCTGSKQQRLEKLLFDTQTEIDNMGSDSGGMATERGSNDVFGCTGSKLQRLEKLLYDTTKELEKEPASEGQGGEGESK